jgi:putative FmdB family regulatory protein
MPFYNYECLGCNHKFEAFHAVNDVLSTCPKCSEQTIKKVPSMITATVRDTQRQQAGERVKEAIEENRRLLLDGLDHSKREDKP